MDVSESECKIVHENLSQNNSSDVPANVIMELKVSSQPASDSESLDEASPKA